MLAQETLDRDFDREQLVGLIPESSYWQPHQSTNNYCIVSEDVRCCSFHHMLTDFESFASYLWS